MVSIKWAAILAAAMPAIAVAQVGPNPSVQGSLDPTVGSSTDAATAPDDVRVGTEPTVNGTAEPSNENAVVKAGDEPTQAKKTTAPTSESKRKPR